MNIVREGLREYVPLVADVFETPEPLLEYSKNLYADPVDPVHVERQHAIANNVQEYVKRIHGVEIPVQVPMVVNVVDHHSLFNNPILIATNITAQAHRLLDGGDPFVVFSTSMVPQDNYFNDIRYHGHRIPFFAKKQMKQVACFMDKHEYASVDRLKQSKKWNKLTEEEQQFIEQYERSLADIDVRGAQTMNEQLSIVNTHLWKQIFDESIRESVPDMYYVTNEDILMGMTQELLHGDHIISRSIFDADMRAEVLARFEGLTGCWNMEKGKGTHFFWHRKADNTIEPLYLNGTSLVNQDKTYAVELTPADLESEMMTLEIVPSLFLIYGFLCLYSGVKPLVGYGSLNYITDMKNAWLELLDEQDPEEAALMRSVNTLGLVGGFITTFNRNTEGNLENRYVMDLIADGGITKEYLDNLFKMKMNDLLAPAAIEVYGSYLPAEARKDHGLSTADVMGEAFDWIQ